MGKNKSPYVTRSALEGIKQACHNTDSLAIEEEKRIKELKKTITTTITTTTETLYVSDQQQNTPSGKSTLSA